MNSAFPPPAARPRSLYWRRRATLAAAAAAGLLLMLRACSGGGPPHLKTVAGVSSVPVLSTYTPTPAPSSNPTATPTAAPEPAYAEDAALAATPAPTPPVATPTPTGQPGGKKSSHGTAAPTSGPAVQPANAALAAAAAVVPGCAKTELAVTLKTDAKTYTGKARPKFYIGVANTGSSPCQVDLGSFHVSFTVLSGKDRIWSSNDCRGTPTHDIRTLAPGEQLWARSVWSKVRSAKGCPAGEPGVHAGTYVLDGRAAGVPAQKRVVFRVQ